MSRAPYLDDGDVRVFGGDCLEVLAELPEGSIDAVVTDPPYGLEFMGKAWDALGGDAGQSRTGLGERRTEWTSYGGSAFNGANPTCATCGGRARGAKTCACSEPDWRVKGASVKPERGTAGRAMQDWHLAWATEALRVLKPGGHLLAFGGTRTFHRLTCAIEDAGFEIRDCLSWLYGSGFPKSLDVSKAIDKAAGAEREVVGYHDIARRNRVENLEARRDGLGAMCGKGAVRTPEEAAAITAPATPEAARWEGWGTALKPAWEPIVVARKPLAGTVAANVLEHGTGALNIDGCRIDTGGESISVPQSDPAKRRGEVGRDLGISRADGDRFREAQRASVERANTLGRFPANVVLEHAPGCRQVGERVVGEGETRDGGGTRPGGFGDVGADKGAPRPGGPIYGAEVVPVFECEPTCPIRLLDEQAGGRGAAAPVRGTEPSGAHDGPVRNGPTPRVPGSFFGDSGGPSRFFYSAKASTAERGAGNDHPTVKPRALMRWLVRLVTPPGGVVLDPFAGSGTTLLAARDEGFRAVGIEREDAYLEIIARRLSQLSLLGGSS